MDSPERIAVSACAATLDFEAAQAILSANSQPLGTEIVPLNKAAGRLLAAPIVARIDSPRHDCAAMDGYALRSCDLDNRMALRVIGKRYAGDTEAGEIGVGEAMRVMTGAPLPGGADRVVMRERCEVTAGNLLAQPRPGERAHVRRRASDFARDTQLLEAGTTLDPFALVTAAAADIETVTVWRRPRVRVLATGDEITRPGSASATPHLIPDSLSLALTAFSTQWGATGATSSRIADDPAGIRAAVLNSLDEADLLVVAGGAARGDRDHCRSALHALGLEIAFADLAIKPGKPVWFGYLDGLAVIGLPGNPTAALTVARLFLAPLLAGLGGNPPAAALRWMMRPAASPMPANGPREAFLCASESGDAVQILERQEASGQALLARAKLLVRRSANAPALEQGMLVPILSLRG